MNHQKKFQSGLTSGSAGLRKNMRDPWFFFFGGRGFGVIPPNAPPEKKNTSDPPPYTTDMF